MSVASATCNGSNGNPVICYGNNGTESPVSISGVSWNTGSGQTPYDNFYMPVTAPGSNNVIESITFKYDTTSSGSSIVDKTLTITQDGKVVSGQNTTLTLKGGDKGLVINNGSGTLVFDFAPSSEASNWNPSTNKDTYGRKMILDLSNSKGQLDGREVSLVGNIAIISGRAQGWFGENQFEATFGGDMIGDITIKSQVEKYYDIKSTFNFNNSASLYGDITVSTGTNTFNFSGSTSGQNSNDTTITGDITTTATLYANAKSIFKFNSSGTNTINGNITAEQVAWAGSNELTFTAGTNIINGNITTIYKAGGDSTPENKITSNSSSTSFTINGSVQADVGGKNTLTLSTGENKINAKDTVAVSTEGGTNTINFSGGTTASIAGDITASVTNSNVAGTNTITFGATTTNTIQGNIKAERYGTTASSNSITFSSGSASIVGGISNTGNGTNKIDFQSGTTTAQITGDVTAGGGTNTITFGATTTNTITGNINASAGTNTLTFNGTSNTIEGNITLNVSGGYENVKNIITVSSGGINFGKSGSTQTILAKATGFASGNSNIFEISGATKFNSDIAIIASSQSSWPTDSSNIFKFNDTVSNGSGAKITEISSVGTWQGFLNGITASNILSFEQSSNSTLTIGAINKQSTISGDQTGNIYIGKGLTQGSGSTLALISDFASSWSNTSHQADINLTISEGIFTNKGANYINVKQITLSGGITANGGSNNIVAGNTTNSGTTSINGNITANGGTNNLYIKETNASATPSLIGNITTQSNGNNNIILEDALWAPTNIPNSGSITTKDGTTTIISRLSQDLTKGKTSSFKINSEGGETNIVTLITDAAKNLHIQSYVDYSAGKVNMIFAHSNNGGSGIVGGGSGTATEGFTQTTNSSINQFFGLTYQDGVKLTLEDKTTSIGNQNVSLLATYGSLYRADDGSYVHIDSIRDTSNTTDTVTITGFAVGTISQLSASTGTSKTYNATLSDNSVFAGSITLDPSKSKINLVMKSASKMILTDDLTKLANLTLSGTNAIDQTQFAYGTLAQTNNTVINIATGGASSSNVFDREDFRVLVIGDNTKTSGTGLQGNGSLVFVNYVNANADQSKAKIGGTAISGTGSTAYADRIVIENAGNNSQALSGTYYMQLAVDTSTDLSSITYTQGKGTDDTNNKNIAVATIAKTTNASSTGTTEADIRAKGIITLQEANSLQGFDVLSGTLTAVETNVNGVIQTTGSNNYITYFVNSVKTSGADSAIQEATSSIFATSLDIFAANFNSLNKRMGELRNNDNSQGVWARVFGGAQSSEFGLGSKTEYVTFQAGYDYAFGFEGANNYLGVALAYSNSSSKTSNATNTLSGVSEGIEGDMKSNMIEVDIYNSYVQDEGWYNDSIFKFNYIMNDFNTSGTAQGNSVSTTNYGIILSDEFGYRFKLGSQKEWIIDPQAELSFGYVNATEYTLSSGRSELQAKSDALMQLRSRFGSSFGYDFKRFTQDKAIKASVYVGAFYEYDYITGGDVTLSTNLGGVNALANSLSSDGRVVMNVGTNMTIKDNTRVYFDFEKSFAGKINTDYQVNVGVRYNFGENTGYTPINPNNKSITPLKVSDESEANKESGEDKEKVENQESANSNSTAQTQEANSTENQTQESKTTPESK